MIRAVTSGWKNGRKQSIACAVVEPVVIAAQPPEMRLVQTKSEQKQARAMLFRNREGLLHRRTETGNALRSYLYESGYTFPQGIGHFKPVKRSSETRTAACLT